MTITISVLLTYQETLQVKANISVKGRIHALLIFTD